MSTDHSRGASAGKPWGSHGLAFGRLSNPDLSSKDLHESDRSLRRGRSFSMMIRVPHGVRCSRLTASESAQFRAMVIGIVTTNWPDSLVTFQSGPCVVINRYDHRSPGAGPIWTASACCPDASQFASSGRRIRNRTVEPKIRSFISATLNGTRSKRKPEPERSGLDRPHCEGTESVFQFPG